MSNIRGEFYLDIAKGSIGGHVAGTKFGRNAAISVGSFSAIAHGVTGAYTGFNATAAETVSIVSSDATDTSAGVGARTIILYGLDTSLLEISETITLTGTTPVVSTLLYKRLDRVKVVTAGTTGHNVGDITINQSTTTAVVFAVVPATYNSTMIAAITVPSNKTAYLVSQTASIGGKATAAASIRIQSRATGEVFRVNGEASINSTGTGMANMEFRIPHKFAGGTDMFIEADGSSAVAITAFMDIIYVTN